MARSYRSPAGRYGRLIEDIRNDIVRMGPFFRVAVRVADMDGKRQQSLAYIPDINAEELGSARARMAENYLIVDWVHRSLNARAGGYRYALERLVIAYPSPMAVDAERALNLLRQQIGDSQVVVVREPALSSYDPRPSKGKLPASK
jgi:hypothetical protein